MVKYLIPAGAAFAGAKFVFDASTAKSLLAAGIAVGALWLALKLSPQ